MRDAHTRLRNTRFSFSIVLSCFLIMSTKVSYSDGLPKYEASILPVAIQYTGEANTEEYFAPTKTTETRQDKEIKVCYFRGMKLVGLDIVPENKRAFIMNKSEVLTQPLETSDDVQVSNQYTAVGEVDKLTIYGHDTEVPLYSKWLLMDEWQQVSDIIHGS